MKRQLTTLALLTAGATVAGQTASATQIYSDTFDVDPPGRTGTTVVGGDSSGLFYSAADTAIYVQSFDPDLVPSDQGGGTIELPGVTLTAGKIYQVSVDAFSWDRPWNVGTEYQVGFLDSNNGVPATIDVVIDEGASGILITDNVDNDGVNGPDVNATYAFIAQNTLMDPLMLFRTAKTTAPDGNPNSRVAINAVSITEFIRGDADGDGDIDDSDLGLAISNFTGPGGTGKTLGEGDNDLDGDVDDSDLGVAISGFTGPLTPVPEPASLALLGMGGLVALRRRRG